MPLITVSKAAHEKLAAFNAPRGIDDGQTTYNADGSVTFPVSDSTLAHLREISPDPEAAILKAMGVNAN